MGRRKIGNRIKELDDKAWLEAQQNLGRSNKEIAEELDCSYGWVTRQLANHGMSSPMENGRKIRIPELRDIDWLRRMYVEQGLSVTEIAKELDCSTASVSTATLRAGIRERYVSCIDEKLRDKQWFDEQYTNQLRTYQSIADEVGCTRENVRQWRHRHGIEKTAPHLHIKELRDKEWLEKRYVGDERSAQSIADEIGCSGAAVSNALRCHGIPSRKGRKFEIVHDAKWLREQYVDMRKSDYTIAREVGCTAITICTMRKNHGIQGRPVGGRSHDKYIAKREH